MLRVGLHKYGPLTVWLYMVNFLIVPCRPIFQYVHIIPCIVHCLMGHYSCVHLWLLEELQNTSSLSAHLNTLCCGDLFTVSFRKRKDFVVCISFGMYSDVISCVACSYVLNMVLRLPCIICTLVILYLYRLLSNVCVPNTAVEPFSLLDMLKLVLHR